MKTHSKTVYFLIAITLGIVLFSCNKKNDVIPYVTVYFELNLNDPQFTVLNSFGGVILVNANTNNLGISAGGYDGNGIIIFAGVGEFYAYDRTCPHDYAVNGLSVKVNIDPSNSLIAICPKCSTNYALSVGGTPSKGVGRYPLKNYRANLVGFFLIVQN